MTSLARLIMGQILTHGVAIGSVDLLELAARMDMTVTPAELVTEALDVGSGPTRPATRLDENVELHPVR